MRKRKSPPQNESSSDSCAVLADRLAMLEKIIAKHFGTDVETLAQGLGEDPVVKEERFDKSVVKFHQSGAIEYLRICQFCQREVADLPAHNMACPKRPTY